MARATRTLDEVDQRQNARTLQDHQIPKHSQKSSDPFQIPPKESDISSAVIESEAPISSAVFPSNGLSAVPDIYPIASSGTSIITVPDTNSEAGPTSSPLLLPLSLPDETQKQSTIATTATPKLSLKLKPPIVKVQDPEEPILLSTEPSSTSAHDQTNSKADLQSTPSIAKIRLKPKIKFSISSTSQSNTASQQNESSQDVHVSPSDAPVNTNIYSALIDRLTLLPEAHFFRLPVDPIRDGCPTSVH